MKRGGWLVASTAVALAGCAGQPTGESETPAEKTGDLGQFACFYRRQVQNFDVLGRDSLIVYAPTRRHAFLVKISPPSSDLRFAEAIGFDSRSTQVCGRAGDRLRLGSGVQTRYSVVDVRRLTPAQLDTVLAGHGRGDGEPLEPQPETEAEIEALETGEDQ